MLVAATSVLAVSSHVGPAAPRQPTCRPPIRERHRPRQRVRRSAAVRSLARRLRRFASGRIGPSARPATHGSTGAPTAARRRSSAAPAGRSTSARLPPPRLRLPQPEAARSGATAVAAARDWTQRSAPARRPAVARRHEHGTAGGRSATRPADVLLVGGHVLRQRCASAGRTVGDSRAGLGTPSAPSRPRSSRRRARRRTSGGRAAAVPTTPRGTCRARTARRAAPTGSARPRGRCGSAAGARVNDATTGTM